MAENFVFDFDSFRNQPLPSEEEIMSRWHRDLEKPIVSVCCITYNHAKFIHDALRGFLLQRTDFPFEVLIHDDASDDGTTSIVNEYKRKYPHVIKVLVQSENQWSRGKRFINPNFLFPLVRGRYIALCEGDDFWVDAYKLQKQFETLESNADSTFCFHKTLRLDETLRTKKLAGNTTIYPQKHKIEICDVSKQHMTPTASLFFRSSAIPLGLDLYNERITSGDFFMVFTLADKGSGLFLNDYMSVYRQHDNGVTKVPRSNLVALDIARKNELLFKHLERSVQSKNKKFVRRARVMRAQVAILKCLLRERDYGLAGTLLIGMTLSYPVWPLRWVLNRIRYLGKAR